MESISFTNNGTGFRDCDNCKKTYKVDMRNIKRGWGLCCSKSCAGKKREMSRPNYNENRVRRNNARRAGWVGGFKASEWEYDPHPFSPDGHGQWDD